MTLFIDDGILKQYYPLPVQVDAYKLKAMITMTQITVMRDTLGDSLYQATLDFIDGGELTSNPIADVIDSIRMMHALATARAVYTTYLTDIPLEDRESVISYITGQVRTLEQYLINNVVGHPEIYTIAQESTDNTFNENASDYQTFYFPNN